MGTAGRLVIFFAGCQAIAFQSADVVLIERFLDEALVFFGSKPGIAKQQFVLHTYLSHGSHQFTLGDQTGSFSLVRFEITILNRLFDQLKSHRNRDAVHVVQAIEQVETLHCPAFAVIIMPAHDFVFIRIGLFLDGVIKNQNGIFPFNLADRRFDF